MAPVNYFMSLTSGLKRKSMNKVMCGTLQALIVAEHLQGRQRLNQHE